MFGYRWNIEGTFSVIKRVFGEYVTARKFVNMAREMSAKAKFYRRFVALAWAGQTGRVGSSQGVESCNQALLLKFK